MGPEAPAFVSIWLTEASFVPMQWVHKAIWKLWLCVHQEKWVSIFRARESHIFKWNSRCLLSSRPVWRLVRQSLLIRWFSDISRGSHNSYLRLPFLCGDKAWLSDKQKGRLQRDHHNCLDQGLSSLKGVCTPSYNLKKKNTVSRWQVLLSRLKYHLFKDMESINSVNLFPSIRFKIECKYMPFYCCLCFSAAFHLNINLDVNLNDTMRVQKQITTSVAAGLQIRFLTLRPKQSIIAFCILLKCNTHLL